MAPSWTQPSRSGLAGDAPGIGAVATDLDNDRAIDLVLTGWRRAAAGPWQSTRGPVSAERSRGTRPFRRHRPARSPLTSTRTAGWTWPSRTGARRVSACGRTPAARDSNASRFPNPRGFEDGDWRRSISTTTAGSTSPPSERPAAQQGEIRLLRNLGGERFADVTGAAARDGPPGSAARLDCRRHRRRRRCGPADHAERRTTRAASQRRRQPARVGSAGVSRPRRQSQRHRHEGRGVRRRAAPEMGAAVIVRLPRTERAGHPGRHRPPATGRHRAPAVADGRGAG